MELKKRFQKIFDAHRLECDYMEIRLEDSEQLRIVMKKSKLAELSNLIESGGNVRAYKNGGWGFVVFNDLKDLEESAREAVQQANLVGKTKSSLADVEPIKEELKYKHTGDPRLVSLSEKIAVIKKYCQIIDEYGEPINLSRARYLEKISMITFANSEGSFIVQEKCDLQMVISAMASQGEIAEIDYLATGSNDDINFIYGLEDEIKKICQNVVALLSAPRIKGGIYTVILDPTMAGVFVHEAFGHLSEADELADNEKLKEVMRLGRKFGLGNLNIYDEPYPRMRGSSKYDDEGVLCQKTYLIKEGKLINRLHSRETAGKLHEKPTGNARAISYKHPPIPRMRTTVIEGGDVSFDEMIKDIKEGVYMLKPSGGKTNGENFTFTSNYGYQITDGKLGKLVKGVTLSGNVFTTLKNIDMIGDDEMVKNYSGGCGKAGQNGLPTTEGSPHIRIQNVTIGGEEA